MLVGDDQGRVQHKYKSDTWGEFSSITIASGVGFPFMVRFHEVLWAAGISEDGRLKEVDATVVRSGHFPNNTYVHDSLLYLMFDAKSLPEP